MSRPPRDQQKLRLVGCLVYWGVPLWFVVNSVLIGAVALLVNLSWRSAHTTLVIRLWG